MNEEHKRGRGWFFEISLCDQNIIRVEYDSSPELYCSSKKHRWDPDKSEASNKKARYILEQECITLLISSTEVGFSYHFAINFYQWSWGRHQTESFKSICWKPQDAVIVFGNEHTMKILFRKVFFILSLVQISVFSFVFLFSFFILLKSCSTFIIQYSTYH